MLSKFLEQQCKKNNEKKKIAHETTTFKSSIL